MSAERGLAEAQRGGEGGGGLAAAPAAAPAAPPDADAGRQLFQEAIAGKPSGTLTSSPRKRLPRARESPALKDLAEFTFDTEEPLEHPDPEYVAFRRMPGAAIDSWDGGCVVHAVRRGGAYDSLVSFERDCDVYGEGATDPGKLVGQRPADVLFDTFFCGNRNLDCANLVAARPGSDPGCDPENAVLQDDDAPTVRRKVYRGGGAPEAKASEAAAARAMLCQLVEKCGSLGAATLPDGLEEIVEASALCFGGNDWDAVFATRDWFFHITLSTS